MELLDKYNEELKEDTKIDVLNLRDVQLKLPAIKHKWVARLISHKHEISKLNDLIDKAKETIIEKQLKDSTVKVSRPTLEKMVENNDVILKIRNNIKEHELLILYLEKVEKILSTTTYDIKNLVEIMKLETL